MKSLIVVFITVTALLYTGCAHQQGPEYDGRSYNQMKQVREGEVVAHRYVVVQDDGSGRFLGALIGAVLGSTMGGGEGRRLTLVGGAILGGVVGNEAGKANAEELTVALDNGRTVVVVVKGNNAFLVGDRVRIIKDGNTVASVQRIPNQ